MNYRKLKSQSVAANANVNLEGKKANYNECSSALIVIVKNCGLKFEFQKGGLKPEEKNYLLFKLFQCKNSIK